MQVSAALVIMIPSSFSPFSSRFASSWTAIRRGKWCVNAKAADAERMPVCLIPPPNSFLNHLALLMKSLVPTRHEPTGAPEGGEKVSVAQRTQSMTCTQPLAETQADRVERCTELAHWGCSLNRNMPQPCTVEMHLQPLAVNIVRYGDNLILWNNCAVQGILKRDDLNRCTEMMDLGEKCRETWTKSTYK